GASAAAATSTSAAATAGGGGGGGARRGGGVGSITFNGKVDWRGAAKDGRWVLHDACCTIDFAQKGQLHSVLYSPHLSLQHQPDTHKLEAPCEPTPLSPGSIISINPSCTQLLFEPAAYYSGRMEVRSMQSELYEVGQRRSRVMTDSRVKDLL